MRGIQLPLSQTQKVRLQKTLEQLESLSSKVNSDASVIIADSIPVNHEDGVLKGHGTADLNGEVVATVCGVVERVNKLVYVRSLRSRYKPEVGDIVIGRVAEVAQKRWRLDINFNQDAVLMLSSMNMPDGVQRRRTALDELNMRCIFEENDVVCAEVRGFQHDGLHLQARSRKYGKLYRGQLLTVPPYLVKRQKQHFHHLEEFGIDLILGCNGFIWVGEHIEAKDDMVEDQVSQSDPQVLLHNSASLEEQERNYTILETRKYICRAANAVRVLSILGFNITLEIIKGIIDLSLSMNLDIHEMLGSEFCVLVAEKEAERRSSNKKKR
ncbi:exosome complex component RRP4 homolog [Vigna unguiculata]|uniref:Exosome complex component RRP4 n=1 Tax=Vigna unguiculata TaxID=3917 RepID=A0A4D6MCR4_VIGUN|nr:exosome complex component RRP4 homolog [Vigna unguiculata]QCD97584.1 exosome complex component RRP4 [Vigna unguiculata]